MNTSRRNRSVIWDHFEKNPNHTAKCNYCSQNISVANGSLGNLSRHLRTKHPTVNLNIGKCLVQGMSKKYEVEIVENLSQEPQQPSTSRVLSTEKTEEVEKVAGINEQKKLWIFHPLL